MKKFYARVLTCCVCVLSFLNLAAQTRTITGTVSDDKGSPLAGATITIKNTNTNTTTDASGRFSVSLPASARTIVVSYVEMQPREMNVGNSNTLNISLQPGAANLTDVVVVGYGRARKANLTTAQVSVGTKEIEKTVNTTIEQERTCVN